MKDQPDWRDPAPYRQIQSQVAANIAWEFLRRNEQYQQTYRAAIRRSRALADRVAARWGLRFRDRPIAACS